MAKFKEEASAWLGKPVNDSNFVGFDSEEEMLPWAMELASTVDLYAAVAFRGVTDGKLNNDNITYAIRMDKGTHPGTNLLCGHLRHSHGRLVRTHVHLRKADVCHSECLDLARVHITFAVRMYKGTHVLTLAHC